MPLSDRGNNEGPKSKPEPWLWLLDDETGRMGFECAIVRGRKRMADSLAG